MYMVINGYRRIYMNIGGYRRIPRFGIERGSAALYAGPHCKVAHRQAHRYR